MNVDNDAVTRTRTLLMDDGQHPAVSRIAYAARLLKTLPSVPDEESRLILLDLALQLLCTKADYKAFLTHYAPKPQ
jgi:hypothetical protein